MGLEKIDKEFRYQKRIKAIENSQVHFLDNANKVSKKYDRDISKKTY